MSDSDDTLAELTRIARDSAQAYFDGDLDTYAGLVRHADDFSLMPPFGGADPARLRPERRVA